MPASTEFPQHFVCIPMTLQAFVATEDFANSKYRIAPLIQPDYAALRSTSDFLKHDIFEQLDISAESLAANRNTRFLDVTTDNCTVRAERCGVYLSWCLPKVYRQGIATDKTAEHIEAKTRRGHLGIHPSSLLTTAEETGYVEFRPTPDRFLIIRSVSDSRLNDKNHQKPQIYILESNRLRSLNDSDMVDLDDIENLAAPLLDPNSSTDSDDFLGSWSKLENHKTDSTQNRYHSNLNVVDGGNIFFADYQPHNTGVFTLFDDCAGLGDGKISYCVIGFHNQKQNDPFVVVGGAEKKPSYAELFEACFMKLNHSIPVPWYRNVEAFLSEKALGNSISVCHGTLKDVIWNRKGPMDENAASLTLQDAIHTSQPISIGRHALDALSAYTKVSLEDSMSAKFPRLLNKMEAVVSGIKDNIQEELHAADCLDIDGYQPSDGGALYHFHRDLNGEDPPMSNPKNKIQPADISTLSQLNQAQTRLDTCLREIRFWKMQISIEWWNALSLLTRGGYRTLSDEALSQITQKVTDIKKRLGELSMTHSTTSSAANKLKIELQKRGQSLELNSEHTFTINKDPTVLFAGVPSGWPTDFDKPVTVRLLSQFWPNLLEWPSNVSTSSDWLTLPDDLVYLEPVVKGLIRDWIDHPFGLWENPQLKPKWLASTERRLNSPNQQYDTERDTKWRQGWFPLYLEWEVEYYHIPWEYWEFLEDSFGKWHYAIKSDINLAKRLEASNLVDCRVISGRSNVGPEVTSILREKVKSFVACINSTQGLVGLTEAEKESIFGMLGSLDTVDLKYFSAQMDGITSHLCTLLTGAHLAPSEVKDQKLREQLSQLGFTADIMRLAESSGDSMPYGVFEELPPTYAHCPFKPATHGQFRFTKLIIVDKFGQVVTAIEPAAPFQTDAKSSYLYPCTSQSLSCNEGLEKDTPNTAIKIPESSPSLCQFFQVQPRINQDFRLSGSCLIRDPKDFSYRKAVDPENPVWGWIVPCIIDRSLHMFAENGEFLVEIRINSDSSLTWLPSAPNGAVTRMENFLKQIGRKEAAVISLFNTFSKATLHLSTSQLDYDNLLPAIYGKPICLVDIGIMLELATPPLQNQSLIATRPQGRDLYSYNFPYFLGNAYASYDGLVLYFEEPEIGKPELPKLFSSFASPDDKFITQPKPDGALTLKAKYISPTDQNYEKSCLENLKVFSAIADPLLPIHVYTGGVCPTKEIRIAPQSIQKGLDKLLAWFKVGPVIAPTVPRDVFKVMEADVPKEESGVEVPVPPFKKWTWLQPRADILPDGTVETNIDHDRVNVQNLDFNFQEGDGVVLEGWLRQAPPSTI